MDTKSNLNQTIPLQQDLNRTSGSLEDTSSLQTKHSNWLPLLVAGLVILCIALGCALLFVLNSKGKNQISSVSLSPTTIPSTATTTSVSPVTENQAGSTAGSVITPSSSYESAV